MATLRVTDKGEVTFAREILDHLGLRPGDMVRLVLLPGGKAELKAEASERSWDELRGFFDGKTNGARPTIEEINDAIAAASAEAGMAGLIKR